MVIHYSLLTDNLSITPKVFGNKTNSYIFEYPCEKRSFCYPYEIKMSKGVYNIELFGAEGGYNYNHEYPIRLAVGGRSGYIQQKYKFTKDITVYLYIGGQPSLNWYEHVGERGYNGGGFGHKYGGGGGGGTDLRLKSGNWYDNLETRFLVAGGGGGSRLTIQSPFPGGDAGGLEGSPGIGNSNSVSCGGSTIQMMCIGGTYHTSYENGTFGKGADPTTEHDGGGGGGYIGGGTAQSAGGGGGSSYAGSVDTYIIELGKSFTEASQHKGNGMAIITILDCSCKCKGYQLTSFSFFTFIILTQS